MRSPDLLLRVGIAATLAVSGYVHADLYGDGYRYVHLIGPAFLVQAAASFAIAILVLAGGPWTLRVAAAALSAGALVAFGLSRTVGIFGFSERGWQPAPQAAIGVAAEFATSSCAPRPRCALPDRRPDAPHYHPRDREFPVGRPDRHVDTRALDNVRAREWLGATVDRDDVRIEEFEGNHRDLERLFRLAEDSDQMLDSYIDLGRVWVAVIDAGEVVGHIQAVPRDGGHRWEILNTAVVEDRRGTGLGRRLLDRAVAEARQAGPRLVELATATADVGVLRFYQRCGFRMSRVVRDVFGPHNGYLRPIEVDGIPQRDQVWFELDLGGVHARGGGPTTWPSQLPAGSVRLARPTLRLAECTAFYRDVLGLSVLFEFRDHAGYSGTVFALPDRFVQLELVERADAASIRDRIPRTRSCSISDRPTPSPRCARACRRSAWTWWCRRTRTGCGAGAWAVADPDGWIAMFVAE